MPFLVNDLKLMIKSIQINLEDMKKKQEKFLLQIQETTAVILAKINSEQYRKEDSILKDDKIKNYLPLTSVENFLEFEDILKKDQEAFMQIVSK